MKKLQPSTPEQTQAKQSYYQIADGISGLTFIEGFDPEMIKILQEASDKLSKHLDANIPNWD